MIAAVAGYALGGGNELAMMCDIVIAADNAKFGQPEINLGIMPGAGGTQRLPRAIGKAKAMDLCLTARMMDAQEAERAGLVSRVVPLEKLMEEAMAVAEKIAGYSLPVVMMIKESINRAYESTLAEGVLFERRAVPVAVRARGPEGRHGGVPREAQAQLQEPLSAPVYLLLGAHILSMLGFSTYAALLPELRDEWRLSNSQAGIVGGMFFAGYIGHGLALDRAHRPRRCAQGLPRGQRARRRRRAPASACCAHGLRERGAVPGACSASGIAATYMPGLRLLSDRISGPDQSRYIAFYTSFFGIGTALSLAIAGFIAPALRLARRLHR